MFHYYCSAFSKKYAYKGLLLYNSLLRWDRNFHFFIICADNEAEQLFCALNLKHATIISLSAIEEEDRQLLSVKGQRNEKEYIWTSKASALLFIFRHYQKTDHIIWLDGDTYFFSDPKPIYDEWGRHSILLTEERWKKNQRHKTQFFGRYNTGFLGFQRDKHALQCLHWFRTKLIQWCYDKHENNLWSDQIYVNDWLERFENVGVIQHIGVNVTPQNIQGADITHDGRSVLLNGQKVIFFHLYGFRYFDGNEFDLCSYLISLPEAAVKWIYEPYMHECNHVMDQVRKTCFEIFPAYKPSKQFIRNYYNLTANDKADRKCMNFCTLFTKDYLVQGLALYSSLKKHTTKFRFWLLCVDDTSYQTIERMNLPDVFLVSLENLLTDRLAKIREVRQDHEYCWTLKPVFLTYLLKNNYNLKSVIYLDADLFFFDKTETIYREWGNHSIYITKLSLNRKSEARSGKYSAGLIGFKRDKIGMKCLYTWQKQCLNWCYDKHEPGLWADQKYLDSWPLRFSAVRISKNNGINAGPWNIKRIERIHLQDDNIYLDNSKLICYHFSGFRINGKDDFNLCNRKKLPEVSDIIYTPYVKEIKKIMKLIQSLISTV